jgi:hypothetical protein
MNFVDCTDQQDIDRKVLCDRAVPACRRCLKSSRKCLGYGQRLSWPKVRDRRRMIVSSYPVQREEIHKSSSAWIINACSWDFRLQENILMGTFQSMCPCREKKQDCTTKAVLGNREALISLHQTLY